SRPLPSLPSFPTRRSSDLRSRVRHQHSKGQSMNLAQIKHGFASFFKSLSPLYHHAAAIAANVVPILLAHPEWNDAQRRQAVVDRSEEHTSELQSRGHLVCR